MSERIESSRVAAPRRAARASSRVRAAPPPRARSAARDRTREIRRRGVRPSRRARAVEMCAPLDELAKRVPNA
eukprot:31143-Pelagococcus_subviridis.AAC.8